MANDVKSGFVACNIVQFSTASINYFANFPLPQDPAET